MAAAAKRPNKLSDFLCFAVYSANLAFSKAYRPFLEELGVTYPQYVAIVALWEKDNQTVSELGDQLFLESNTLTPMLKKLEALGYIRRTRGSKDERQVIISLTAEGRRLREKSRGLSLGGSTGLSDQEFGDLQKKVKQLRDNLVKTSAEYKD